MKKYSFTYQLRRPYVGIEPGQSALQEALLVDIESWGASIPVRSSLFTANSSLKIILYRTPSEFKSFQKYFNPHKYRKYYLLVFELHGDINESKIEELITSLAEDEREEHSDYFKTYGAVNEIELEINNFFIAANIAFPGGISTDNGASFYEEKYFTKIEGFYAEGIYSSVRIANDLKWPKLHNISILETLQWLNNNNFFINGIAKNSIERALAAFSHLIIKNINDDRSLDLVWALLGLEAIYTKGNVGLKEQLTSKTETFLGSREENKKEFGKMYDFRSRFIHGDLDIPLHFHNSGAKEFEQFYDDLYRTTDIATITLIATFQKMIINKWTNLSFKYSVEGS